jgi:hypothetical protein
MIKPLIVFLSVILTVCPCFGQAYEVWGAWNVGKREDATIIETLSTGRYFRDRGIHYLIFEQYTMYTRTPTIGYEGGLYTILEILDNYEEEAHAVAFYVEIDVPTRNASGEFEMKPVIGKVVMHFIDQDHIWLEIDYTDTKYPTHPEFITTDFPGKSVTYWRGGPVPPDYEPPRDH